MKMVKGVIAVSLVAFLGLMGAVSMAEARYVGHSYHGIARGYGGYRHYGYGRHYGHGYYPYRRYGYGSYRSYGSYGGNGYYSGGCGWLYRNAIATGNRDWWNRYVACTIAH